MAAPRWWRKESLHFWKGHIFFESSEKKKNIIKIIKSSNISTWELLLCPFFIISIHGPFNGNKAYSLWWIGQHCGRLLNELITLERYIDIQHVYTLVHGNYYYYLSLVLFLPSLLTSCNFTTIYMQHIFLPETECRNVVLVLIIACFLASLSNCSFTISTIFYHV